MQIQRSKWLCLALTATSGIICHWRQLAWNSYHQGLGADCPGHSKRRERRRALTIPIGFARGQVWYGSVRFHSAAPCPFRSWFDTAKGQRVSIDWFDLNRSGNKLWKLYNWSIAWLCEHVLRPMYWSLDRFTAMWRSRFGNDVTAAPYRHVHILSDFSSHLPEFLRVMVHVQMRHAWRHQEG